MTSINPNCAARMEAMLNHVPPQRITLVSPYDKYTQYQLDMRRKAEVLQYRNGPTRAGGFTKKQLFAKTVTLTNPSSINTRNLAEQCASIDTTLSKPMPASASGVPGGGFLFYDPSIPLYNYVPAKPAYAFINPEINI